MKKMLICTLFALSSFCKICHADISYFPQDPWVEDYVNAMPWHHYGKYNVPGLGKFWVDNAKDCVKDTIKSGKIWETYIINVIRSYVFPGDKVIDIGGHMGTITMAMSNLVGDTGKVYTFEGERQFFRELYHNLSLNNKTNVIPHLCWVSNENKVIQATWFYGPEYSPVHLPEEITYPLNVRTLDSFELQNIKLMKIDVECTEDQVLEGAYNTIMTSRPILVIEIMGGYGHDNRPEIRNRIAATIAKLNALNYHVTKIYIDDYLAIPRERL